MNWFYFTEAGEVVGPLSEETLGELHAIGRLAATTQVCREGSEDWISLAEALGNFTATPAGGGESVLPSAAPTVINTLPQSRQTPGSPLNVQHAARQVRFQRGGTTRQATPPRSTGKKGALIMGAIAVFAAVVAFVFLSKPKKSSPDLVSTQQSEAEQKKSTQDVPLPKVPEKKEEPSDAREKALANKRREAPQKVGNTEQKAVVRTDLNKWRISGVHLGMSKEQVVKTLAESLGPGLQLEKEKTSRNNLTRYTPKLEGADGRLGIGLSESHFYFAEDERLQEIILDFEVIKKSSGLSELGTKPFAQQLMQQLGISELKSNSLPVTRKGVVHLLHEAIIPSGSDCIRVAIQEIDNEGLISRQVEIGQVKPLSFGKAGTLFGLQMGMPRNEVTATLKTLLGNNTTLVEGNNIKNQELPTGLTAYDIIAKRDTLGTGERGFVVFDKNGRLCEIFFNSDQLYELSSCQGYAPKSFGPVFMSHFNLGKMDVEANTDQVKYKHSDVDFIYIFMLDAYTGYSIYIIKQQNKVKF
jgi:hypothetical protein